MYSKDTFQKSRASIWTTNAKSQAKSVLYIRFTEGYLKVIKLWQVWFTKTFSFLYDRFFFFPPSSFPNISRDTHHYFTASARENLVPRKVARTVILHLIMSCLEAADGRLKNFLRSRRLFSISSWKFASSFLLPLKVIGNSRVPFHSRAASTSCPCGLVRRLRLAIELTVNIACLEGKINRMPEKSRRPSFIRVSPLSLGLLSFTNPFRSRVH